MSAVKKDQRATKVSKEYKAPVVSKARKVINPARQALLGNMVGNTPPIASSVLWVVCYMVYSCLVEIAFGCGYFLWWLLAVFNKTEYVKKLVDRGADYVIDYKTVG